MKDIKEFYRENSEDIHILAEEENISRIHALIRGPVNTPYEKGFFYFIVDFPREYPLKPPNVRHMTSGNRTVRFNPNLYADGKVCLSILGTWTGPGWSPANTLYSTLLSIQSLMNEKPLHNEPEPHKKFKKFIFNWIVWANVQNYNDMIAHETIRVAVIGMLRDNSVDARNMPQPLRNIMIANFKSDFAYYESVIRSKLGMDGKRMYDMFRTPNRLKHFQYKLLLNQLLDLKIKFGFTDNTSDSDTTPTGANSSDPLVEPYNKIVSKLVGEPTNYSNIVKKNNQSTDGSNELLDSDEQLDHFEDSDSYIK